METDLFHQHYMKTLKPKSKTQYTEEVIKLAEPEIVKLYNTAHVEHGFIQVHSIGFRGYGKTTYGEKIAYYLLKRLHPHWRERETWEEVVRLFVVDLDPESANSIWPILYEYEKNGRRAPFIALDDLAKILGKYTTFVRGGYDKAKAIQELWEQFRSLASGIYLSSTKPNVIKPILESNTHGVELYKVDKHMALAVVHEYSEGWWRKPRWDAIIEDRIFLSIPDFVREALDKKRMTEIKDSLDRCKQVFKKVTKEVINCCHVYEVYMKNGGKVRATARELNMPPSTVVNALERHRRHIQDERATTA